MQTTKQVCHVVGAVTIVALTERAVVEDLSDPETSILRGKRAHYEHDCGYSSNSKLAYYVLGNPLCKALHDLWSC